MTYNIWNFNRGHNWETRVNLIASIINLTNPGIFPKKEISAKNRYFGGSRTSR